MVRFGVFAASIALIPLVGVSFFPRTDAGQFVINLKAPSGTRLSVTEGEVAKVENLVRQVVRPSDLGMIVANIGTTPDFSAIYTPNSAMHTAFVQVSLKEGHKIGSYEYMDMLKRRIAAELPELTAYFQSGGLVDAVLNLGMPAPIDVQVAGSNMECCLRYGAEACRSDPQDRRCGGCLHPAGPGLPGAQSWTSTGPAPANSA